MTTLKLGPIIGKLGGGGAEVQKIPVSGTATERGALDLHTVEIPAGQTWLVVVSGHVTSGTTSASSAPYLQIGTQEGPLIRENGEVGMAAEVSGNTTVSMFSQLSYGGLDFSGHVYAVPLL